MVKRPSAFTLACRLAFSANRWAVGRARSPGAHGEIIATSSALLPSIVRLIVGLKCTHTLALLPLPVSSFTASNYAALSTLSDCQSFRQSLAKQSKVPHWRVRLAGIDLKTTMSERLTKLRAPLCLLRVNLPVALGAMLMPAECACDYAGQQQR